MDVLEINVWFEICKKCNIKINLVLKGLKAWIFFERPIESATHILNISSASASHQIGTYLYMKWKPISLSRYINIFIVHKTIHCQWRNEVLPSFLLFSVIGLPFLVCHFVLTSSLIYHRIAIMWWVKTNHAKGYRRNGH